MSLKPKFALAALILFSGLEAARADALDAARQAGQVGERPDGTVGIVSAASPDIANAVAAINAQRLATYKNIAQRTGTSLDAVEAQAGQKLVGATPPGQFVMDASGQWKRK